MAGAQAEALHLEEAIAGQHELAFEPPAADGPRLDRVDARGAGGDDGGLFAARAADREGVAHPRTPLAAVVGRGLWPVGATDVDGEGQAGGAPAIASSAAVDAWATDTLADPRDGQEARETRTEAPPFEGGRQNPRNQSSTAAANPRGIWCPVSGP